ncbi:hypothetical protein KY326_03810, partial [Candidatus Woesearchaeota archaeon]|nr:hypothetical protein [Candidatus Woesearchaeota archaeon]
MATEYRDPTADYNFDSDEFYEHIDGLRGQNKQGEAKTLVEKALEISPNNTDLLHTLGVLLFEMDRTVKALEMFHRARDLGDEDSEIDYFLGESYFFMDQFGEAKKYYDVYLQKLEEEWRILGKSGDKNALERISYVANSFYDNDKYIEALKYFRFIFRNAAPTWMNSKDYFRAANCLHKLKALPEEKYRYLDSAIMFANGHVNLLREKYALLLFEDGAFEDDEARQKDYAERAIEMFETIGIRKIRNIGSIKKLQFLYKYNRNWNNRTRKRMKQCNRRIEELEN